MKRIILILLFFATTHAVHAEHVRVRLYSTASISTLNISFDLGNYNLYASSSGTDTILLETFIGEGRSVLIRNENQRLHISVNDDDYGTFNTILLQAADSAAILCLNPTNQRQRTYEGSLKITPAPAGTLCLIADVDFETYIAGVVQSEIYGNLTDIFRIQAIISRTWALRNINKHNQDGYNFCDGVHCQAYLNRCIRPDIMLGVIRSSGQTLVDTAGNLIDTPFHSNSGGQTANSEDVWRAALPYLRSVQDTFSLNMRQSDWVKSIAKDRWLSYFKRTHKLDINNPQTLDTLLHFKQPVRQVRILGIPLTRIRTDWQLKSTFFSIDFDSTSDNIILHGHGYGHGVGLSQEGAIRMINLGIPYDSVLHHYYTGAQLQLLPSTDTAYINNYVNHLTTIISQDSQQQTQSRSKKDDWLGRLFRLRDREEREEIYIEQQEDTENEWQYEW